MTPDLKMPRVLQVVGLLCLTAAIAFCDQKNSARPAPQPRGAGTGRAAGGAAPKFGPRITNPASPAARLYRMSPEERDRALEKLPAQQQEQIRKQLAYFDSIPKDQQQIMLSRTERFAALPPEKKQAFMRQMRTLNQLPQERRQMVGAALRRLQTMPDAQREVVLNSPAFQTRFTPEEQNMIRDLSEVLLPPM